MATRKYNITSAVLLTTILWLMLYIVQTTGVHAPFASRQKRHLVFPYGYEQSYLEFIFGLGLPMDLPSPYAVLMSIEIRADYLYPTNATDFTDPTLRLTEKLAEAAGTGEVGRANANGREQSRSHSDGYDKAVYDSLNENDANSTETLSLISKDDLEDVEDGNVTKSLEFGGLGKLLHQAKKSRIESKKIVRQSKDKKNKSVKKMLYVKDTNAHRGVDNGKYTSNENAFPGAIHETKAAESNVTTAEAENNGKPRNKRNVDGKNTRWMIYHILETAANSLGMEGRACMLRSICEAAATPLHHHSNGLIGELLHVIFTPSTTDDDRGRHLDNEYRAAERLGVDHSNSCHLIYPECDVSFLDMITKFDLK